MWFNKISVQFAQPDSKQCFLALSLFFWPQCVLPISISTCHSLAHLFSAVASHALLQESVTVFHHFISASPYKPETLTLPLPRCWKWRESGKGVITMSIHKHCTPRDCMDESTNASGKLPTQPGQVICFVVEQNIQTPAYTHKAKGTNWG